MEISVENIKDQIPYYLTQESKENLANALKTFPDNFTYYINLYPDDILQGDGWSSLGLINYETGEHKLVRGIIFSNSCDLEHKDKRDIPIKLVFAPIIKLNAYAEFLEKANIDKEIIENKFLSIRNQGVTTLFYLPTGGALDDEYVALLDDVHSIPFSKFLDQKTRSKLFTLSQHGFYLFLLKLSVHFCRFQENLIRNKTS